MAGLLDSGLKAGVRRTTHVEITNSDHKPPPPEEVSGHMVDFVKTLNDMWKAGDSEIRIGAYAMWRLNWIHPFSNGNGRTSRLFSYFLMCMKTGYPFPGREDNAILDALAERDRRTYEDGLAAYDKGKSKPLEDLISQLLIEQLKNI